MQLKQFPLLGPLQVAQGVVQSMQVLEDVSK